MLGEQFSSTLSAILPGPDLDAEDVGMKKMLKVPVLMEFTF